MLDRRDPFWPAQATVLAAILLHLTLPGELTLGPVWMLPLVEGGLLIGLIVTVPHPSEAHTARRRRRALILVGFVSAVSIVSLGLLVHHLLAGGRTAGRPLILAGAVIWSTNVLLFAVWFWELDRGGSMARFLDQEGLPDFAFFPMTVPELVREDWRPGFVDYLYLSLTNATAFSPTDTMPLTPTAKVLMGVQSLASLVTVGLVIARAVNILA